MMAPTAAPTPIPAFAPELRPDEDGVAVVIVDDDDGGLDGVLDAAVAAGV